jgi:PAS domain S-box-containing protein
MKQDHRFGAIVENAPMVITVADKSGNILYLNRTEGGLDRELFLGKSIFDLIDTQFSDTAREVLREVSASGSPGTYITSAHIDGYTWIYENHVALLEPEGADSNLVIFSTNITEKKNAEILANENEERYRQLVEESPDTIVIHCAGKIAYINKAGLRLLELSSIEEIAGRTAIDFVHPEDRERVGRRILQAMQTGSVAPIAEERFLLPSGKVMDVEVTGLPHIYSGKPAMQVIIRDITDRKAAEAEIIKARERAEESDRLKSTFLANMSHEIRTPMNAIVGFAELLSDPGISTEERKHFSTIIQSRSDDLMHIINDLLEISRIESGNATIVHQRVDLNLLMDDLEAVFSQKLERTGKKISMTCLKSLASERIVVVTDGYILRQVFANLIDNAIKYTPEGEIVFGYDTNEGDILHCFVTDTGIGISRENQKVIFEHFRQAEIENQHRFGGTGLGLSICKGSLSLLDGTIGVESEPGKGSTFRFSIPLEPAKPTAHEPKANPAVIISKKTFNWTGKKILVVEDEESNMEFLKVILAGTKALLVPAYSGSEVRNLLSDLMTFDLVLLDIRLPDASGWDLAREIKSIRMDLPVIVQTAFAMSSDRLKGEEAGCDDYISKPISKDKLLKLISVYI